MHKNPNKKRNIFALFLSNFPLNIKKRYIEPNVSVSCRFLKKYRNELQILIEILIKERRNIYIKNIQRVTEHHVNLPMRTSHALIINVVWS